MKPVKNIRNKEAQACNHVTVRTNNVELGPGFNSTQYAKLDNQIGLPLLSLCQAAVQQKTTCLHILPVPPWARPVCSVILWCVQVGYHSLSRLSTASVKSFYSRSLPGVSSLWCMTSCVWNLSRQTQRKGTHSTCVEGKSPEPRV